MQSTFLDISRFIIQMWTVSWTKWRPFVCKSWAVPLSDPEVSALHRVLTEPYLWNNVQLREKSFHLAHSTPAPGAPPPPPPLSAGVQQQHSCWGGLVSVAMGAGLQRNVCICGRLTGANGDRSLSALIWFPLLLWAQATGFLPLHSSLFHNGTRATLGERGREHLAL